MSRQHRRVVILGGGMASLTAAYWLSGPGWDSEFDSITVYQRGWRLGGKGASGRGIHDRIEEHGLHLWFGFYDNAFHTLRGCYEELQRSSDVRIATIEDAFRRESTFVLQERRPDGWLPWIATFPEDDRIPGDPANRSPSLWQLVIRALELAWTQAIAAHSGDGSMAARQSVRLIPLQEGEPTVRLKPLSASVLNLLRDTVLTAAQVWQSLLAAPLTLVDDAVAAALTFAKSLDDDALVHPGGSHALLQMLVEQAAALGIQQLKPLRRSSDAARRQWYLVDLLLAGVRGVLSDGLLVHGIDVIDCYDFAEWLQRHGAEEESARSALITTVIYDSLFAYQNGDPRHPKCSAANALRGISKLFFDYKGALAWKMNAGMGDIVFAPLYELLRERGVQFEFFHRVDELKVSDDGQRIENITLTRQVDLKDPSTPYEPLVTVDRLPCWPSEPRWEQLSRPEQLKADDLECAYSAMPGTGAVTLRYGDDFDTVILGLGVGAFGTVCRSLIERNPEWRAMVAGLGTVWTQAFQLWISRSPAELGDVHPMATTGGYTEPFDTYCDMSHLIQRESWEGRVRGIAYFCNALPTRPGPVNLTDHGLPARETENVRRNAIHFLREDAVELLPDATHRYPPDFRWELLVGDGHETGEARFATQYWRANVDPSDRYVQSLPGTSRLRMHPKRSGFYNLVLAGDWTDCGLNVGCIEAAVTSGMLAANALCNRPTLDEIVEYDHL